MKQHLPSKPLAFASAPKKPTKEIHIIIPVHNRPLRDRPLEKRPKHKSWDLSREGCCNKGPRCAWPRDMYRRILSKGCTNSGRETIVNNKIWWFPEMGEPPNHSF